MTELDIFFTISDKPQQGDCIKGLILRRLDAYCGTAAMHEPQYATLFFSLTRTVLFLKETALDSILNTYQENHLEWTPK